MHVGIYARFRSGWLLGSLVATILIGVGASSCRSRQASWQDLNDAAVTALSAGRSVEAEGHLQAALELARKTEPDRVPLSLHRLARFHDARQRYVQAAEFYQQAYDADSKRLKADDPALWDTVKRLAEMHEKLEQVTEAKEVYKRFLASQEAALGQDALPLAATLVQIGRLARMRSAYDEAEESFQRALSIRILHLGQDNDELPEILDEYVALLRDTEQPYKADLMEERAANLRMRRTARRIQQGN